MTEWLGKFIRVDSILDVKRTRYGHIIKEYDRFVVIDTLNGMFNKNSISFINESLNLYTIDQKKYLLDSFGGRLVYVKWKDINGENISLTIQSIHHELYLSGRSYEAFNTPINHETGRYMCINHENKENTNINLETLFFLRCGTNEFQL